MAILLFQEGIKAGQVLDLVQEEYSLGRHHTNDIVISDPLSSRYHAKIVRKAEVFYFIDLDSHNGTYVNSLKIKIKKLSMKDTLKIGKSIMILLNKVPDILEEQEALENLVQDKINNDFSKVLNYKGLPSFEKLNPAKYGQVQGNYNQLFIMNQINNIFSFTKDLKEAILKMAKFFCEISNADRVYFTGYNSLKNFFSPINGIQKVENNFEKLDKIYFVEEFYLKLIEGKISVWLKNTDLSKSFKASDNLFIVPIYSCFCFPLAFRDKIIGIVQFDYLDDKKEIPSEFIYLFNKVCPLITYSILSRT